MISAAAHFDVAMFLAVQRLSQQSRPAGEAGEAGELFQLLRNADKNAVRVPCSPPSYVHEGMSGMPYPMGADGGVSAGRSQQRC